MQIEHAVIRKSLLHRTTREDARIISGYTLDGRSCGASCVRRVRRVHAYTHTCSLWWLRVSWGVVHACVCELRLSAVAREPFCCPLCEQHRFDTCRVADIKAWPRVAWGLVTKIATRLRAICIARLIRVRKLHARLWYQCGTRARKRCSHHWLCNARWFFNKSVLFFSLTIDPSFFSSCSCWRKKRKNVLKCKKFRQKEQVLYV